MISLLSFSGVTLHVGGEEESWGGGADLFSLNTVQPKKWTHQKRLIRQVKNCYALVAVFS